MNYNILIFGATGMMGYSTYKNLPKYLKNAKITGIVRNKKDLQYFSVSKKSNIKIFNDFKKINKLKELIKNEKPNIIINCLGLIKQRKNITDNDFIYFNSIFPKILEVICRDRAKIINISTDCVFSGKNGNYDENSLDFSTDIYGISKYLGEVTSYNNLTLRTSIIGHEIKNHYSLLDWFINNQNKKIPGFSNAYFSGLTTLELVKIISKIINKNFNLNGLYHVSSSRISKLNLLKKINSEYSLNKQIIPFKNNFIDRSLNSNRFKKITKIKISNWNKMIREMQNDH